MFRTVPLSIIKSFSLCTQQWYMSYLCHTGFATPSWFCSQAVRKPVWHIPLLRVQWKTPYEGRRNCPKHVEFYSKSRFEKLVHLVSFIIRSVLILWTSWIIQLFLVMCYFFLAYYAWPRTYPSRSCKRNPWRQHVHRPTSRRSQAIDMAWRHVAFATTTISA